MIYYEKKKLKKGFTLIEAIVYLALFGIVFLTIVQFTFAMAAQNKDNEDQIIVEREVIFLNEHLNESFTNTQSINEGSTVFNNDTGSLFLTTSSGLISYTIVDGSLIFNSGSVTEQLTSVGIRIDKFHLERVRSAKTGNLIGARIELALTATSKARISKTIQTSYIFE